MCSCNSVTRYLSVGSFVFVTRFTFQLVFFFSVTRYQAKGSLQNMTRSFMVGSLLSITRFAFRFNVLSVTRLKSVVGSLLMTRLFLL